MFGELSLVEFFLASPTMIVLAICSIITVGFTIERLLYFRSSAGNTRGFMDELANRVKSGNPRGALEYCTKTKSPVARVMAQGITHLSRNRDELQQRLDTAIDLESVELERNLGVLGTMSNIAPLHGLSGTVIGIIRACADIARTGSGGGAVVAMGVSEALMTTAAGIVVAVIATVFFNYFVRQIRTRTAHLEDARESFFTIWHLYHKQSRQAATNHKPTAPAQRPQPVATQAEETLSSILS